MFKKILFFLIFLILLTPFVLVWIGNVSPPRVDEKPLSETEIHETSQFFNKSKWGVHHVFLNGTDFQRGQQYGYWTQDLLLKQEKALISKLDELIPYNFLQYSLFLFSMGWFQGLDHFYEQPWLKEMYGVSLFGSKKNRFFATPFTRQLAYHGIHDMGQMMIDHGLVLGACTQVARPLNSGWLIGRNFDFEAGRVFDVDKVLKWVFPKEGQAFVSVIFSGMVGVISGVNASGVYIAINAAGSEDFTRLGTPTSLLALKALQSAKTAKEAVEVLKQSRPLITDIFVIADRGDKLYIVEKTPSRTRILEKTSPSVVTNHLQHPDFADDSTNLNRLRSNTTLARFKKAQSLLKTSYTPSDFVKLLRDKVTYEDQPVYGHRASIDALIASHSLIYNSQTQTLYVAKGPSLSKEFIGIDLQASFQKKKPVLLESLPTDPELRGRDFYQLKAAIKGTHLVRDLAKQGFCEQATKKLSAYSSKYLVRHYAYHWAEASIALCLGHKSRAQEALKKSLDRHPAYARERKSIETLLQSL